MLMVDESCFRVDYEIDGKHGKLFGDLNIVAYYINYIVITI